MFPVNLTSTHHVGTFCTPVWRQVDECSAPSPLTVRFGLKINDFELVPSCPDLVFQSCVHCRSTQRPL